MKKFMLLASLFVLLLFVCGYTIDCEYAIAPAYEYASGFSQGVALVTKNEETAVINRAGEIVIGFDSRPKRIRSNGLIMIVGDNDMGAFFNQYGTQLTDYVYDTYKTVDLKWGTKTYHLDMDDGDGKSELVPFSRGKKFGYINSWGTEIVPPIYEYAYGFVNGIARICAEGVLSDYGTYTNGKYGFILENGTEVLPPDSYWVASHEMDYGYAWASNGEVPAVLVDRSGRVLTADATGYAQIDCPYIELHQPDGKTAVSDRWGGLVIPWGTYENITYLQDGCFIIDYKKLVNHNNEVIYQGVEGVTLYPHYLGIYDKSSFVRVKKSSGQFASDGVYGLLNTQGEWVMPLQFEELQDMGEALICGVSDGRRCLYDYAGQEVCELDAAEVGRSSKGMFFVRDRANGQFGYMANPLICPKVLIDGKRLASDVLPRAENNRTLVPMRAVFETFGAEVLWNGEKQEVTAIKDDVTIRLILGDNVLYKNGEPIPMDVPAKAEENRTLIPLRVISESLGYEVLWDAESYTVYISTK